MNGFGVEEAGIDGGGIFKDFMENITRAAFDVQYALFKVVHPINSCEVTNVPHCLFIYKPARQSETIGIIYLVLLWLLCANSQTQTIELSV